MGKKWELNIYMMFSDYISKWTWPSRINGSHLHELFSNERKDKHGQTDELFNKASKTAKTYIWVQIL